MTIDMSKPHIGRIYDFVLGGHHNYEVDRQAAAEILKRVPTYPQWARLNRWFLQLMATNWAQEGRKQVLDLATGLPTEGHFNDFMPNARILFSDNDAVSVAYGEEMLKNQPNMKYRLADIAQPESIIKQAADFFGADRKLAIGLIGIAYLLPDEVLQPLLRTLGNFCAPGSILAITFLSAFPGEVGERLSVSQETFRRYASTTVQARSIEQMAALADPWRVQDVKPLPEWLGVPDIFTKEEYQLTGAYLNGGLFVR